MANSGSTARKRPLSPHLSIWRWGAGMLVSILHRVTGNGMAVVGLGLFLWWLGALASGADSYVNFIDWVDSPLGWLVLVGLSWSFFQHMLSGIRHLVLDIGAGYELHRNNAIASALPVAAIVMTALFWAFVLLR